MSKLARDEIAKALVELSKESGTKIIYAPALYCNVVTETLNLLGFTIRYYDFPYIADELKREIIEKNYILITVIFPDPCNDILLSSSPIHYKYELYDCVLINPKYRYKYLDLIANSKSVWAYRKFFGIEHAELFPFQHISPISIRQKLLALKQYYLCRFRRAVIGRKFEQKVLMLIKHLFGNSQNILNMSQSINPSQFEGIELEFIFQFKSHFAHGKYSDEFWFEFLEKNSKTVDWPGAENCIDVMELQKFPHAFDFSRNQAASFRLYRDQ